MKTDSSAEDSSVLTDAAVRKARQDGEAAFPGHGRPKAPDEEMRRLRCENAILRQGRDTLL